MGELVGRGFLMATPLFHTNFLPDLTHVYLIPADVLVRPSLLQVPPGLTAADAIDCRESEIRVTVSKTRTLFCILKV